MKLNASTNLVAINDKFVLPHAVDFAVAAIWEIHRTHVFFFFLTKNNSPSSRRTIFSCYFRRNKTGRITENIIYGSSGIWSDGIIK